jgi:hypothetical protein
MTNLEDGGDVDQAIQEIDEAEMDENEKDEAYVMKSSPGTRRVSVNLHYVVFFS